MSPVVAHLSDLHFGTETPALADALVDEVRVLAPDLVVVSGDLTQRARRVEFAAARAFLDRLPAAWLAVPGNHDLPLWDVGRRLLEPRRRFRRFIEERRAPLHVGPSLRVLGLDTTRADSWKHGRVRPWQVEAIARLADGEPDALRVLVTHHPFVPPPEDRGGAIVAHHAAALAAAERARVDLLLAGHVHQGYSAGVREYHPALHRPMVVGQAGTALSHRRRGEPNAYNVIRSDGRRILVELRVWNGERFAAGAEAAFPRSDP